jgi:ParB family chromosome partitioning protein
MPKKFPKLATQAPVAMAEPLELPPPPPKVEIEQVLLRDITPSLYQPRRFQRPDAEDPDLLDLARSIRAKGVIQPILLRPIGVGYELVVGERRVRASRLELPELDAIGPAPLYIPAVVRQLSDSEAAELTVEENLRRKDLLPLEEADGVHTLLLLHKGDPLAVAARLGQTPTWVACRARIHSNLSTSWKELLADPECPLRAWTAGHVEEIAKLAQEVQDEILNDLNFDSIDIHITVPELRRHIADLTRKLGRAPFPLDDETLHPSVGACTNCPLTTLAAPLLFADQGDTAPGDIKDARCLNRTCWIEKCHRAAERAAAKLRDEHPDLLFVAPREVTSEEIPSSWRGNGLLLPADAYEKVKKGAEGAQPAMLAGGSQAGRLVWVKPTYPMRPIRQQSPEVPASEPSAPETAPDRDLLAERRARHMNRRIARMAELTKDLLEACDGKILSLQILVALARVFGTNQSRKGVWHYGSTTDPWADLEAFCDLPDEEAATEIWTCQLQPVLASRLQYCGPNDAARLHREIVSALKLIGANYADLYRTVANSLPEPKAWAKLPGYEPEDLEGEPPAPIDIVLTFELRDEPLDVEDTDLEAIPA